MNGGEAFYLFGDFRILHGEGGIDRSDLVTRVVVIVQVTGYHLKEGFDVNGLAQEVIATRVEATLLILFRGVGGDSDDGFVKALFT